MLASLHPGYLSKGIHYRRQDTGQADLMSQVARLGASKARSTVGVPSLVVLPLLNGPDGFKARVEHLPERDWELHGSGGVHVRYVPPLRVVL